MSKIKTDKNYWVERYSFLRLKENMTDAINQLVEEVERNTPITQRTYSEQDLLWDEVKKICEKYIVDFAVSKWELDYKIGGNVVNELSAKFIIERRH